MDRIVIKAVYETSSGNIVKYNLHSGNQFYDDSIDDLKHLAEIVAKDNGLQDFKLKSIYLENNTNSFTRVMSECFGTIYESKD